MRRMLAMMLMAAGMAFTAEAQVAGRQAAQTARIQDGVQDGSLSKGEAARLRANRRQLHRNAQRDRVDGGGLTAREQRKLQKQANRNSRAIARLKHNNRTR